ncbi:MAG: hypothetical protein U0869_08875 [Chloroflexota bacterium]
MDTTDPIAARVAENRWFWLLLPWFTLPGSALPPAGADSPTG